MSGKRSASNSKIPSPLASAAAVADDRDEADNGSQDSDAGSTASARKKRKRAPGGEESTRKAQNRISQRESRQRKALHTQQLERELELYKLGSDDRIMGLLITLGIFIEENTKIRQMLASLSSFIGDSGGGLLAARGIDLKEIKAASLRNDREWIFQKAEEVKAGIAKKQPSFEATTGNRKDGGQTDAPVPSTGNEQSLPAHSLQGHSFPSAVPEPAPSMDSFAMFADLLGTGSAQFGTHLTGEVLNTATDNNVAPSSHSSASPSNSWPTYQAVPTQSFAPSNTLASQAKQLILFHLRSRADNPFHSLPPALEPTFLQNLLPHDASINAVLWPGIRDKLITAQNGQTQSDPASIVLELDAATTVHPGNDLLDPASHEIAESFIRRYPWLLDLEVIATSNKWRSARGDPEVSL